MHEICCLAICINIKAFNWIIRNGLTFWNIFGISGIWYCFFWRWISCRSCLEITFWGLVAYKPGACKESVFTEHFSIIYYVVNACLYLQHMYTLLFKAICSHYRLTDLSFLKRFLSFPTCVCAYAKIFHDYFNTTYILTENFWSLL